MYAIRQAKPTRYSEARRIVRSYMADYTGQSSAPQRVKGGFYAILMKDTGEVWLSETASYKRILSGYRSACSNADCVKSAIARGSELELYLLTRPELFSAQQLEDELWRNDLLAFRKTRNLQGPGKLYVIRHDITSDYFVVSDRKNSVESTILSNFYGRMQRMGTDTRNVQLQEFVTAQADDILKGVGFTIAEICEYDDREDEWLKRQVYIDENKYGNNLNWQSVD